MFVLSGLSTDPPPAYTEKDEIRIKAEERKREEEERRKEEERKMEEERIKEEKRREEERRKAEELPPWVRYHNLHGGDPHKHCQCIHNQHHQQWYPVSAQIVAKQPKVGSGPKIKEIL